jgi:hypothetical protein
MSWIARVSDSRVPYRRPFLADSKDQILESALQLDFTWDEFEPSLLVKGRRTPPEEHE